MHRGISAWTGLNALGFPGDGGMSCPSGMGGFFGKQAGTSVRTECLRISPGDHGAFPPKNLTQNRVTFALLYLLLRMSYIATIDTKIPRIKFGQGSETENGISLYKMRRFLSVLQERDVVFQKSP